MAYTIRPTGVGVLPRGQSYTVKDLGGDVKGYMDMVRQELGVSRTMDPWVRFIQLHELTHIQHSKALPARILSVAKKTKIPVKHTDVLAAEDARVNTILTNAIPTATDGFELPRDLPLMKGPAGYVASWKMPADIRRTQREQSGLDPKLCDTIDRELARLSAGPLTVGSFTVELARLVRQWTTGDEDGDGGGEDKPGDGPPMDGKGKGEAEDKDKADKAEAKDKADRAKLDEETESSPSSKPWEDEPISPELEPISRDAEWRIPKVESMPLTQYIARPGTHDHQSTDSGIALEDVTRAVSDGMVFSRSRRRPGTIKRGTILIDGSGSMALNPEDVAAIIKAIPLATVAIYDGPLPRRSGGGERAYARITIVAQGGKMADMSKWSSFGGNTCDGPALLWLSRMPGPRIWYCDGATTDKDDRGAGVSECDAITRAGHILHIYPGPRGCGSEYSATRHADTILAELRKARLVK